MLLHVSVAFPFVLSNIPSYDVHYLAIYIWKSILVVSSFQVFQT